jgi:hypothetical protein
VEAFSGATEANFLAVKTRPSAIYTHPKAKRGSICCPKVNLGAMEAHSGAVEAATEPWKL